MSDDNAHANIVARQLRLADQEDEESADQDDDDLRTDGGEPLGDGDDGDVYHQSTHVPRPREHELPNGDLAVSSHWVHGVHGATTVSAEDRPLYRLLLDLLEDEHVPDLMPAHIATECRDIVAARRTVLDIDRGRSDIGDAGYGMGYCYTVRDAIEDYWQDQYPVKLVAVGCSSSKHDDSEPLPAAERYRGGYWTNKREYYEAVADDSRIISAEHSVLHPETPIHDYDKTVDDLEGVPVDASGRLPSGDEVQTLLDKWALDVYEGLRVWIDDVGGGIDPRDVKLEVLLGKTYQRPLEERCVFDALRARRDLSVSFPFREEIDYSDGGGVGKQRSWLSEQAAAAEAATDGGLVTDSGEPLGDETLHVDDDLGLWIPNDLREFDQQIVFRTPKGTIQHFGSTSLEGYYGMIDEDSFGSPDELLGPRNPELAPNRVSIKPQGEEAQIFEVDDVE